MGKPRLIIIIRHGQSEGNKNRDIHQTVPDHRVKLTNEGWQQAYDAGRRLRAMLRVDDTLQFFTSPYRRTRETTEGILQTLTSDTPEPSPFKRNNIKVYEEPRLREQDFGNFQPCSAEMERMWQERADYGHFFYRIPNGESAADAYDRVSGFNESLWRQFGDDDFASVCVLVTHGLMSRVFLMKWYHFSVEYFEDLRNINHCEFLIMRKKDDSGKYELETKLRTWSELRRERAALLRQKEEEAARDATSSSSHAVGANGNNANNGAKDKDNAKLDLAPASPSSLAYVPVRRWGGCPDGCDHDKGFKIRSGFADLVKRDGKAASGSNESINSSNNSNNNNNRIAKSSPSHTHGKNSPAPLAVSRRQTAARRPHAVDYTDDDDGGGDDIDDDNRASSPASGDFANEGRNGNDETGRGGSTRGSNDGGLLLAQIDVTLARAEIVSSPDATPSFITPEDRKRSVPLNASPPPPPKPFLHVGRDFGGTYSGHTSDADSSEDDRVRRRMARLKMSIGSGSSSEPVGGHAHNHNHNHHHAHVHAHSHIHSSHRHAYGPAFNAADVEGKGEKTKDGVKLAQLGEAGGNRVGTAAATASTTAATTTTTTTTNNSNSMSNIRRKRIKNMANRLGDVPHYSDCEQVDDDDLGADERDRNGNDDDCDDGDNNSNDELASGGAVDGDETDVDHDLSSAEKRDRSICGSVY
ncbi:phosphoglycerate mutase family domain containing protein [Niveomyces insectorum RCEF 264]|uniref:Phosphoglycerate mutase family domain containing protein n=1 Tax=Niveomyces insectorum RCEF 264 TaxID=1081102 RepID=A0A167YKZ1_9HYPO|nr:phosphoglycerate mutase family domain containing protein [Niveomyces insectorum RCEF 264]